MKQLFLILGKLTEIARSTTIWLKVLILVVVIFGGAILIFKNKQKSCEDCTPFKQIAQQSQEQTQQLIKALIEIKKDVKSVAENTKYEMDSEQPITYMYARYDSIPRRKRKQTQQQIKLGLISTKIDSIIYRVQQQRQVKF